MPDILKSSSCFLFACCAFCLLAISHCSPGNPNKISDDIADGKKLSLKYCKNCHMYPQADLIDKINWEKNVLPAMATKLGLTYWGGGYFAGKQSSVSIADWHKIVKYYAKTAPVSLKKANNTSIIKGWSIFKLRRPQKGKNYTGALTTMISFDVKSNSFYTADAQNHLFKWNGDLKPRLLQKLPSPATSAIFKTSGKNQILLTCIGTLAPVDADTGKLVSVDLPGGKQRLLETDLQRPVQIITADLDKDGINDYVICNFGHNNGGLFWLKGLAHGKFEKKVICNLPGATNAVTGDFNHDQLTDIICLFAQADEGIWLFQNDGKGSFVKKNLLRFPAVYGSSSFQLIDMNCDGSADIVYTAGDNADLSPIAKPYHGVYVFLNDGKLNFTPQYFYPMNGCTKAIAADFKHNGILDIVAIAFFTVKDKPGRGFVYLEQTGSLKFIAHELPIEKQGTWLTMDVNDYNNDGYKDVALGNFSFHDLGRGSSGKLDKRSKNAIPFVVLQNQLGLKNKKSN